MTSDTIAPATAPIPAPSKPRGAQKTRKATGRPKATPPAPTANQATEPRPPFSGRFEFTGQAQANVLSDALRAVGIVHTITVNGDYTLTV